MLIYSIWSQSKNSIVVMLVGFIFLFTGMQTNASSDFYVPPIGIPAPEFGINETVESVYGSDAYFTHYVDNTHPGAIDDDNSNGNPGTPRMTIPRTLAAGSVVEVRGGPYNISSGPSIAQYQMNGTAEKPVFIRGISNENGARPQIIGEIDVDNILTPRRLDFVLLGRYFIVENLEFFNRINIRFERTAEYGTLRNSEVHNPVRYGVDEETGSTFQFGYALNPTISAAGTHTVVYNNEVHDNHGAPNKDVHGIQGSAGGDRIWILNNTIYKNGGNGFQACNGCNNDEHPTPRFIYIGGNEFYSDKEVGIALKYAEDVIISENIIRDYSVPSTTATVAAIIIGADGYPFRTWVLNNQIYNSIRGIRIEEAVDLWMMGNVIYDIDMMAFNIEKTNPNTNIVGNTVVNANVFINQRRWTTPILSVQNNIVADMRGEVGSDGAMNHMNIASVSVYNNSTFSNNLFWQSGSDVILKLGQGNTGPSTAFSTTADFKDHPFGNSNIIADPRFEGSANNNYQLLSDSPAVNSGATSSAYQLFQDTYGISLDIKKDINGLSRPQQSVWDRGAIEYTDSVLELITHSLTNAQVGVVTSYPIIATGGTAPYTWNLSAGALPNGLSLSDVTGIISGTPTLAGDYNFTLTVQDSVLASDIQSLSMTVDAEAAPGDTVPPVITLMGNNPQTITVGSAYTELGATALDNVDGNVDVTIDISAVDTATVGSYTVTYNAIDAADNAAVQIIRTVNVSAAPVNNPGNTANPSDDNAGGGAPGLLFVLGLLLLVFHSVRQRKILSPI